MTMMMTMIDYSFVCHSFAELTSVWISAFISLSVSLPDKLFGKSFRPPEIYSTGIYDPVKVDVFCLGWMLYYTVSKKHLFDRATSADAHWKLIINGKYAELLKLRNGSRLSHKLKVLLWKMLNPDPNKRPTTEECLRDPWFLGLLFNSYYVWLCSSRIIAFF